MWGTSVLSVKICSTLHQDFKAGPVCVSTQIVIPALSLIQLHDLGLLPTSLLSQIFSKVGI